MCTKLQVADVQVKERLGVLWTAKPHSMCDEVLRGGEELLELPRMGAQNVSKRILTTRISVTKAVSKTQKLQKSSFRSNKNKTGAGKNKLV